ncbi:MAG: metallophosphoesterase [Chloroflexota bacterium]
MLALSDLPVEQSRLIHDPGALQLVPWLRNTILLRRNTFRLCVVVGDAVSSPIGHIHVPYDWHRVPASLPGPTHLTILHLNDLHGHIARLTPYGTQPILSRIAWYRRQLRASDPGVLMLSAGDDTVGSAFDSLLWPDNEDNTVHAAYRSYRALGLDAAAVGNHDLDHGTQTLARAAACDAQFPLLSANLVAPELSQVVYPAAVFIRRGIRIGVIGLTTPARQSARTDFIRIAPPEPVLNRLVPALREICDVIIVLSHLGFSTDSNPAETGSVGDVELAQSVPAGSIDLIIGGHSHHVLNEECLEAANVVNGIPIVQAGANGRFLGHVTIMLESSADGSKNSHDGSKPVVSVAEAH